MRDPKTPLLIVLSAAALLALGATAQAAPGTATVELTPEQQKRLLPQGQGLQLPPSVQLPPMARLASAGLSIYNSPFDTWCKNNAASKASGRVSVQIYFPRPTSLAAPYANLVVDTGLGQARTRIRLNTGTFSASTSPLEFAAREICSDRCVSVRLEPEGTPSGYTINTAARQACVP